MLRCKVALIFAVTITSFASAEGATLLRGLPNDFYVYAVGTYSGQSPLNYQIDDSGLSATQVDVVVNTTNKPVVLVLTAHDPVVWRVGRTEGTRIAGILVTGHYKQVLIGVDDDTPVAVSTHEEKGDFPYFSVHKASRRLLAMNDTVKQLLGREIDFFYNKPIEGIFYVSGRPDHSEVLYSKDRTVDAYVEQERPLIGQRALDALVKENKLRVATQADIDAWIEKASEKYKRFNPDLRVDTHMHVGRTYVVMNELTLPNGLFGADSRSFILPDDVPYPTGPRGHNRFYFMDGTVTGTGANASDD